MNDKCLWKLKHGESTLIPQVPDSTLFRLYFGHKFLKNFKFIAPKFIYC